MSDIIVPHNWKCRPYQNELWNYLHNGGKRAVAVWHRRSGKDEVALHWACVAAHQRCATYWHMLPEASQARKAIWDAINPHTGKRRIDEAFPMHLRHSTREQEMLIKFLNGSTWQVVGSDNYNSLVGSPPAGVVYSEWSLANPLSWGYIRPILAENGGWSLFIYTPRGRNHGADLYESARQSQGWLAQKITVENTDVFTTPQLAQELKEYEREYGKTVGTAIFRQEYHCSFDAAVLGAVYGEWIEKAEAEGRITNKIFDPDLPVYTAWDIGHSDATAIWWYQVAGQEIRLIDYYEATQQDVWHFAERLYGREITVNERDERTGVVKRFTLGSPIAEHSHRQHYKYVRSYLPHDAVRKLLEAGGRSVMEQLAEFGIKCASLRATTPANQFAATRQILPRCWFDAERTYDGVKCLKNYHFDWNSERKVLSEKPIHDWSSHGCFTRETEILTRNGMYQISKLPYCGEILTLCGWKPYTNPHVTRLNAPLVEVVFTDGLSVRCTPDHLFLTAKGWKSAEFLKRGMQIQSSLTSSPNILMEDYTENGLLKDITHEEENHFIERYGLLRLVSFLKDVIFIIKMAVLLTIDLTILNVCQPKNICLVHGMRQNIKDQWDLMKRQGLQPRNGTLLKKESYGIEETQRKLWCGKNGREVRKIAQIVMKNLMRLLEKVVMHKFIVPRNADILRILSVEKTNVVQEVYCLTVPHVKHFSLSNGAIVHNCDAFEIIGQAQVNPLYSEDKPKPRFLSEMTANELFFPENSGNLRYRERI